MVKLGGALEEQGEMVNVLVEDYKQAVTDVTSLDFNGDALDAEIDCTGRNKEFLLLDNESVVEKLVEECGACKAAKLFKVGCFFENSAVVLEATERSNKKYEEELK